MLPNAVCMPVANTSAFASPVVTRRAGQQDVPAAQQVVFGRGPASRDTGRGFTRDRGVVHAHAECLDQPAVGGHVVAGAQQDHVAGHDILGREHDGRHRPAAL